MRAGFVVTDITPLKPLPLMGYAGKKRISKGCKDKIEANVLHLRSGNGGLIVISLDLFWLNPVFCRTLRREIAKHTALNESNVFITCTHNYYGPVVDKLLGYLGDPSYAEPDQDYLDFMLREIVAASAKAAATTRDVELAGVSFESISPQKTGAIYIRDINTKEIPSLMVIAPFIPIVEEEDNNISAGYSGMLRKLLRAEFGGDCVVLNMLAPYNPDAVPLLPAEKLCETIVGQLATLKKDDTASWLRGEVLLRGLLEEVKMEKAVFPSLWESKVKWAETRSVYENNSSLTGVELEYAKTGAQEACSIMKYALAEQSGKINSLLAPYFVQDIQCVLIGNVCILGMPGMVSQGVVRAIIEKYQNSNIFIVTPANGNIQGYAKSALEINKPVKIASPLSMESIETMLRKAEEIVNKMLSMAAINPK